MNISPYRNTITNSKNKTKTKTDLTKIFPIWKPSLFFSFFFPLKPETRRGHISLLKMSLGAIGSNAVVIPVN